MPMPCWPWSRLTHTVSPGDQVGRVPGRVQLLGGPAAGGEPERRVALDAQPAPSAAAPPSGRRPGRRSPAGARTASASSSTVVAQRPSREAARVSGYASPGPPPNHSAASSGAPDARADAEPRQRAGPVALRVSTDTVSRSRSPSRRSSGTPPQARRRRRPAPPGSVPSAPRRHVHGVQAVLHPVQAQLRHSSAGASPRLPGRAVVVVGGGPPHVQPAGR